MPSQQKKKQPARDLPPIAPDQCPSTRRNTRSRVSAEPSEVSQPVALGKSKGKRKAQQSLMRPSKRANARKSPETQSESTSNNVKERNLQIADVADVAGTSDPRTCKTKIRAVPRRPVEDSDSDSIPGNGGEYEDPDNNGGASPLPSDDDSEEPDLLTMTQLASEYPTPVNANTTTLGENNDNGRGAVSTGSATGRRAERIIGEVPVPGQFITGHALEDYNDPAATAVTQQPVQPVLFPAPNPLPTPAIPVFNPGIQPQPMPALADLIQDDDGSYKQTSQHPEISAFLSATVKQATINLVLFNAFPSLHVRDLWLVDSLRAELAIRRKTSNIINAVAERVEVDEQYLGSLLSMVNGRWSGFRQGVADMARELIRSDECSYEIHGDEPEKATTAAALLKKDSFHFGRTNAGVTDTAAPYRHQEMLLALSYFFKGNDFLKGRLPTGDYGSQIPEPMVALTATALEVALLEMAEGRRIQFSEKLQRERYISHLATIAAIRLSREGGRKLMRLLSNIYKGTMTVMNDESSTPAPAQPARETMLNTDNMEV